MEIIYTINDSKCTVTILEKFYLHFDSFSYINNGLNVVSLISRPNFFPSKRKTIDLWITHSVVDDWWKEEREGRRGRNIRDPKEKRRSVDPSLEILHNHIRANNSLRLPRDLFVRIIKINSNDFLVPYLWCHCLLVFSFANETIRAS